MANRLLIWFVECLTLPYRWPLWYRSRTRFPCCCVARRPRAMALRSSLKVTSNPGSNASSLKMWSPVEPVFCRQQRSSAGKAWSSLMLWSCLTGSKAVQPNWLSMESACILSSASKMWPSICMGAIQYIWLFWIFISVHAVPGEAGPDKQSGCGWCACIYWCKSWRSPSWKP